MLEREEINRVRGEKVSLHSRGGERGLESEREKYRVIVSVWCVFEALTHLPAHGEP